MDKYSSILIAGSETLLGKALSGVLKSANFDRVILHASDYFSDATQTRTLFEQVRPEFVFVTAGRSAGIKANIEQPASLMRENLAPLLNLFECCKDFRVKKIVYTASSCVYPKDSKQPMKPEYLLTGPLEQTSQSYALTKLLGLQMCSAYRAEFGLNAIGVIPADVFGPDSDFDSESAHVIPALIKKFHRAKQDSVSSVSLWGSGRPVRDFIYTQDAAAALLFIAENAVNEQWINVSAHNPQTIASAARQIADAAHFKGQILFDNQSPDGVLIKTLDASPLHTLGWKPKYSFNEAILQTYESYLAKLNSGLIHA